MPERSDHYNGHIFLNPVPTEVMRKGAFARVLKNYFRSHPNRQPRQELGPFKVNPDAFKEMSDGLRISWLGHSTTLIEIDGKRFLTDPVWYDRASPFLLVGPKRFLKNPLKKEDLPPVDYILLSHDHYDHLDKSSILYLAREKKIPVITMAGVGDRLIKWGVDRKLVTQLDWWQECTDGGFRITATPARHFSGRWFNDRFSTLWGGFAISGPQHKVFFGGDSGYFDGFRTIGERLGPFDLAMLEIGAYFEEWPAIHMGPEDALCACRDLGSPMLLPIHWATFSLSFHPWKEPVEILLREAARQGIQLVLPAPGEACDIAGGPYNSRWWERY